MINKCLTATIFTNNHKAQDYSGNDPTLADKLVQRSAPYPKASEIVALLLRQFTDDKAPQGIPLVVFIDEIDGIATQEGMTGLISELKSLYEERLILPIVAGNLSALFVKGMKLSQGSHKPFWLQPLSSAEDLETLLEQRINIEKPRLETIPNPEPEGRLLYRVWPSYFN